jgi:cytochrome P450
MPQLHTVHRDAERFEFFAEARGSLVFFDQALDCWVASDPKQCAELLHSPRLAVSDYATAYETLSRAIGREFPNFLFAFRHIPLCLNHDAHRAARRRLAEIISRRRTAQNLAIPGLVARHFGRLKPDRDVDLMSEVLEPLVSDLIELLIEVPIKRKEALATASLVFDRLLGIRRRQRIEADLGVLRAAIREGLGPEADEDDVGDRLALCILGHDTLLGTLGESLHQIFRTQQGVPLSQIDFPTMPSETGVPVVERVVIEPVEVGGVRLAAGSRIRLLLQSLAYSSDPGDRAKIFGVGIHTCLGRQMSLDVWARATAYLHALPYVPEVMRYDARASDFSFTCPATLVVRFKS